jgi:hypothetical protein
MIPPSDIRKLLGGRSGGSDAESAHFDMLESDFTLLSPHIRRAYHEEVIKGPFSEQLGSFTTIMMDEISSSMEHVLKRDQEGNVEIKVFDTMAQVIAHTANRVFVGKTIGMLRTRICLCDSSKPDYHRSQRAILFQCQEICHGRCVWVLNTWVNAEMAQAVCLLFKKMFLPYLTSAKCTWSHRMHTERFPL